jgi:hypothetical protein
VGDRPLRVRGAGGRHRQRKKSLEERSGEAVDLIL